MTLPVEGTAISLEEAARSPLLFRPVHVSTIHRWRLKGLRGIKLKTWLIAGRRVTTVDSLAEFLVRTNQEDARQPTSCMIDQDANEQAKVWLRNKGIEGTQSNLT